MARSFSQLPPNSTGNKHATRRYTDGADDKHSQGVYFDGLPTYGLLCEGTALAANAYHLYLRNDTGSAQTLWLLALYAINVQTAAITGGISRFNLLRVTGTPTQTAVTPFAFNTADPALAGVTAGRAVTAGLTDGQILRPIMVSSEEQTASAANVQQLVDTVNHVGQTHPSARPKALRPGEALAIKQVTAVTAGGIAFLAHFALEPD
jgi:hypothetical protein